MKLQKFNLEHNSNCYWWLRSTTSNVKAATGMIWHTGHAVYGLTNNRTGNFLIYIVI